MNAINGCVIFFLDKYIDALINFYVRRINDMINTYAQLNKIKG